MRILEFEVKKQRLLKKPSCDFSGLVAGSVGYLHAKFHFVTDEWAACTAKLAQFWIDGKEHATFLDQANSCEIPPEVLLGNKFEVSVIGVASNYNIPTNKISVRQEVH